jgi:hypothetical protein
MSGKPKQQSTAHVQQLEQRSKYSVVGGEHWHSRALRNMEAAIFHLYTGNTRDVGSVHGRTMAVTGSMQAELAHVKCQSAPATTVCVMINKAGTNWLLSNADELFACATLYPLLGLGLRQVLTQAGMTQSTIENDVPIQSIWPLPD